MRVCVRDVKGILPDLSQAVESVESGFVEAQAHPDWGAGGRLALPARVTASCQDQPIIYADGVIVRRFEHWVGIFGSYSEEVAAPGPYDLIIFVMTDEEIDHFFWTDSGTKLNRRRYVTQEAVCSWHGTPPNTHGVCGETTAGLYVSAAEVLDRQAVAAGILAGWRRSR